MCKNNKRNIRNNYCRVNRKEKIIANEKQLFSNYIFVRLNYFNKKQLFLHGNR